MKFAILDEDNTVLNIIEVDSVEHADLISVGGKQKALVSDNVKIGDLLAENFSDSDNDSDSDSDDHFYI